MSEANGWFGLAGKLVWPVLIVGLILVFHKDSAELATIVKDRIKSGSAFKVGLLEVGEHAGKTSISALVFPDLPVEAIGGPAEAVTKANERTLTLLRNELRKRPYRRVDTLLLDSLEDRYSPILLREYISSLGVRFVVFRREGRFDGWIEASLFISQLWARLNRPAEELRNETIPYSALRQETAGISDKSVKTTDSVRTVLEAMQKGHTENLPVLDGKTFKFFANRGEILGNLISKFILEKREGGGNERNDGGGK